MAITPAEIRTRLKELAPRKLAPNEGFTWAKTAVEYDAERHGRTQGLLELNIEATAAVLERLGRKD